MALHVVGLQREPPNLHLCRVAVGTGRCMRRLELHVLHHAQVLLPLSARRAWEHAACGSKRCKLKAVAGVQRVAVMCVATWQLVLRMLPSAQPQAAKVQERRCGCEGVAV